jgi:predicted ATPase
MSQMIRGEALIGSDLDEGLKEIAAGLNAHREMEAVTYQPFGISLLVKGLIAAGRLNEALGALERALATSARTGERFYLAELLRLKGEILARKGSVSEAEHWLNEAIQVSRQQGAKLFELRSAVNLCRVLDKPRTDAALREVLAPVYEWFEEGHDAPDLRDARALLAARTGTG